jgi:hypothetical protein
MFKKGFWTGIPIILGLLLTGCSTTSGPDISIENAWGRPSPKVATAGAFYLIIKNNGNEGDKLVAGESPACGVVELHESYMTEDGAMGMRPVEGGFIEVPAGGEVELKIGGLHIMCIDKLEDFTEGSVIPLTLNFEKSGDITFDIEIRQP